MHQTSNSIYVELPSNGSSKYFPANRVGNYKNQMMPDLALDGRWQVGLTETMYPKT